MVPHRTVRTTCPYCGVGCGVLATPDEEGRVAIAGDPEHPSNYGRLCSKGSALGETLDPATRLFYPKLFGRRASWLEALDHVAAGFKKTIAEYGPDAVAFYLSGQLLTEDYYVPNKLMKGFIGSANVDTNSRLCMSSSVAGHKRAFGSDTVPGCYEDLDAGELFVLVGSNAAWCHPILFQRMVKAQEHGAELVTVDVRRTATSDEASLHLQIAPGQDTALFSGLLVYLVDRGFVDHAFVDAHTEGFEAAVAAARAIAPDIETTASRTRLNPADVERFFRRFAETERVVTLYSQGVNQSAQGTDKVNAILNCHLATGRIGRLGMGPFSLTGQPNAMGGREVGGLANQLAAHMGFTPPDIDRVGRFWRAASMALRPGLIANELFDAVGEGKVKALWIMGTNAAVSLPQAGEAREALRKLDLLVVSDVVAATDTAGCGVHVHLPSQGWSEKDGTVTNSERRITRQRRFSDPVGEAMPDWWAVKEVAKRLGFSGFDYTHPSDIFREHARLSAFENNGSRDFDIGALGDLDAAGYEDLAPAQWPLPVAQRATPRFFANGNFFTPSGKGRFIEVAQPGLAEVPGPEQPLLLNTGRIRDQWHTMTRTGLSPRLGSHIAEPFVAVSPADAARFKVCDGGLARVSNSHGSATYRVKVTETQEEGQIFVPIHWNDQTASDARTGSLVHAIVDPHSGQPDSKATPVALAPVEFGLAGFMLSRHRFPLPRTSFWSWAAVADGFAAQIETGDGADAFVEALRAELDPGVEMIRFSDPARHLTRVAFVADERLVGVFFLSRKQSTPKWSALADLWKASSLDRTSRRTILSGKSSGAADNQGPNVCSCFGVPFGRIADAVRAGALTAPAIGQACKAGTNCGSCIPELKRIIVELRKESEPALQDA